MEQLPVGTSVAALEQLLGTDWPAMPRCWGVLDGSLTGTIWVDRWPGPRWVVVTELADGTTYVGGRLDAVPFGELFAELAPASAEIVVGLPSPDHPLADVLPVGYAEGSAIDFTDRRPGADAEPADDDLPAGFRVVAMDVDSFRRAQWFDDTVLAYGSLARWQQTGLGSCVLLGERMVCEALAGPPIRGTMEMAILTHPEFRGRGLASVTARHLARSCEARGFSVWWNANAANRPSLAVARRIGFRRERPYRLLWWPADRFAAR